MSRLSIFYGGAVTDEQLSHLDVRVLAFAGTFNSNNGWTILDGADLAKRFGTSQPHIRRSIETLVRAGYMRQRGKHHQVCEPKGDA